MIVADVSPPPSGGPRGVPKERRGVKSLPHQGGGGMMLLSSAGRKIAMGI